jgi:hypothetical protein
MVSPSYSATESNDPRKLRELLGKASDLAREHAVGSVLVGMAAPEGDLQFPEIVNLVTCSLRVEDAIFRLTRERALVFLADVDRRQAGEIMDRVLTTFRNEFPARREPELELRYYDVPPGCPKLTVKQVLPAVFSADA